MKVLQVNTGLPQKYEFDGVTMETSMVRTPQSEIQVTFRQVVGDRFTSPQIHGTSDSVVYALSADRYPYWNNFLNKKIQLGHLGENLSIDILREDDFYIGDDYEVGQTVLRATSPRYPCNRLNFVTGDKRMQSAFEESAWPGVYFSVLQEGIIRPGDQIRLIKRNQNQVSILDLYRGIYNKKKNKVDLQLKIKLLDCEFLPQIFKERL